MVADQTDTARDHFLDRYGFEGEARETAKRDLSELAAVLLRIASRISREKQAEDSPE